MNIFKFLIKFCHIANTMTRFLISSTFVGQKKKNETNYNFHLFDYRIG